VACPCAAVVARKATQARVLAALGAHNVMLVPHGVVLVPGEAVRAS
jgi:hypothetical protein